MFPAEVVLWLPRLLPAEVAGFWGVSRGRHILTPPGGWSVALRTRRTSSPPGGWSMGTPLALRSHL